MNYVAAPLIHIDSPAGVTVSDAATFDGFVAVSIGDRSKHGHLLISHDAARDLAAKLTAALEDAPGTSTPMGGAA